MELLQQLITALGNLREQALEMENAHAADIALVEEKYRASARNLLHYLGLRQSDIRELQRQLTALGLSSLGRSEEYTLADIDVVLTDLCRIAGETHPPFPDVPPPVDFTTGPALLDAHTEELLGPAPPGREVRIMVTMPVEAGREYRLVHDLLVAGMDIMRINCAHDARDDWMGMVENLRRAKSESQRECRILVDLGGPKLRTGALEAGPQVVNWRPRRDVCGIAKSPARIWLTPADAPQPPPLRPYAVLYIEGKLLQKCRQGDTVIAWDCEGIKRFLPIEAVLDGSCWAESTKTVYMPAGAPVELRRGNRKIAQARLGALPPVIEPLVLHVGDTLMLTTEALPGRGPTHSPHGELLEPARIPCTLPEVFQYLHPGERIYFDDGNIGGVIRTVSPEWLEIDITLARAGGTKLRPDKGINLPDSKVCLPALTEKDLQDLDFALSASDFIGLSFVHTPEDIESAARTDARARRGEARHYVEDRKPPRLPKPAAPAAHRDALSPAGHHGGARRPGGGSGL